MKKLLLLAILLLPISPAIASDSLNIEPVAEQTGQEEIITIDENTKSVSTKYFDLVLTKGAQLPFGKKVNYEIEITPHADSTQTQIEWIAPSTIEVKPRHQEFVSIGKSQTKTYRATLTPTREGTYAIAVNVTAWQYDTNYTNTIEDTIVFDENLVLQPVSAAYTVGNILKIFVIILCSAAIIILAIFLIRRSIDPIKKWLTPDF